jgi:hypothetical protein
VAISTRKLAFQRLKPCGCDRRNIVYVTRGINILPELYVLIAYIKMMDVSGDEAGKLKNLYYDHVMIFKLGDRNGRDVYRRWLS